MTSAVVVVAVAAAGAAAVAAAAADAISVSVSALRHVHTCGALWPNYLLHGVSHTHTHTRYCRAAYCSRLPFSFHSLPLSLSSLLTLSSSGTYLTQFSSLVVVVALSAPLCT